MSIRVGDKVPNFELDNQYGKKVELYTLLQKKVVVLFFYPKDDTPGCTKEVCSFRDSFNEFEHYNVTLVGVNYARVETHKQFSDKNKLPYMLLSDKGDEIREIFGVPKTLGLLAGRVTYVIGKDSVVQHIYSSQLNFKGHAKNILTTLSKK